MAVAVSDTKTRVPAPKQASRWRRVFHTLIAAAGWAVFAYWWTIVVGRVSPHEVRFTVLFVLGSFVLCILVTGAWVLHNLSIFRRRGPRTKLREVKLDYSRDPLGRTVRFEAPPAALLETPVVRTLVDRDNKSYRPMRPDAPTGPGSSRA